MLKNKTMICRRSLFLCCVLMQFLLNASRDSQTTKTSIKSSFLNQYDNVRHIYFYWICNETVFMRARCFNKRFMKWADLHAVLITMKCVSFVCKCVNVSVSFLIIFLCTSPLTFKKKCSTEKKINKQGERALSYEWKWSLCLDTQKMQCRYCEVGTL